MCPPRVLTPDDVAMGWKRGGLLGKPRNDIDLQLLGSILDPCLGRFASFLFDYFFCVGTTSAS